MNTHILKANQTSQNKGSKVKLNKKMAKSWTIDFQLSPKKIQELMKRHQDYYYGISTFEFNIFEFSNTVGRNM